MDIGDWLRRLGLSQYEAVFRENEIDGDVLPELTDQHLKDLGLSLGHRLKILRAIRELREEARASPQPSGAPHAAPPDAAERRHLNVMIVDLVGSTALAERLDPEDMREVLAAYHTCCAGLIGSNGGFVAKYMGDGVLAYFGYPQAHEQDAENAVSAALSIVAAAPKLNTAAGVPLHVRVGVATGIVVVGDLLGSGEAQERGVVGETPNLAARLQGIAEPDMVIISEGTRKLLGDLFDLEDLGTKKLKGIAEPVQMWAALRANTAVNRFEAMHAAGLTELVGREKECELLRQRWEKSKTGEGQVLLLCGEAGIGKSRLTVALLEHSGNEPHVCLRYFCSQQHTDDALFPIIDEMERAIALDRDDVTEAKLGKLDAYLAGAAISTEDASLFAEMLSLPNDGRYPLIELAPQKRRQRTLDALIAQIEIETRSSPVLMIFEDAQWSDPTSLELLGMAVGRIRSLRALLIVTFRPEFDPPWIGQSHVTQLSLNRLTPGEVGLLIDNVAGGKLLLESVRRDIIERCDGIPLFVEEMTKATLETGGETRTVAPTGAGDSWSPPVPAALHASLMARLDRLGNAKAVAQIGAAIGREFSQALLAAVAKESESELSSALDDLVGSGMLFRWGAPPHATYQFKHALVRDAAYGALLRDQRRALHASIAEVLENQFSDIAERQPALLARHCTEAGLYEEAASHWARAGLRSLERSALVEAAEQLSRALDQISALPSTPGRRQEQIRLQFALANALKHVRGFAAPETKAAEERARLLVEQAKGPKENRSPDSLSNLVNLFGANFVAFNGQVCRDLAEQIFALAKRRGTSGQLMTAHYLMGMSLACTGELADARTHLDRAFKLYDPVEQRALSRRIGLDFRVQILSYRSIVMWILGHPEAAIADAEFAIMDAREIDQAGSLMFALNVASLTHICCRNYATAAATLDELTELANEKRASYWQAGARATRGSLLALTGKGQEAVREMSSGWAAYGSTGATWLTPTRLTHQAIAYANIGQIDRARDCVGGAIAAVETSGERWFEAEVQRTAGDIELLSPERDEAKARGYFERALEVARAQQARSWELRAAASLARLWRDQGRRQEAHDLLAPVNAWFTEGFDTPDLKEAKSLLGELAC